MLPLCSVAEFAALATAPSGGIFVAVQLAGRLSNFALARSAREVLFTAVPRQDRCKAKTFIHTVVYRSGDQIGSWAHADLIALGLGMTGVAIVAVPLSAIWFGLSLWLWRQQRSKNGRADIGTLAPRTMAAGSAG